MTEQVQPTDPPCEGCPEADKVLPATVAAEPAKVRPISQGKLTYSDDVKMPVKMLIQHLDSLPAGHPQKLPGFLVAGLKNSFNIMENDIVITVMSDGSLEVGNMQPTPAPVPS